MNAWKVILATVVIFSAGLASGGFMMHMRQEAKVRNAPRNPVGAGGWNVNKRALLARLDKQLSLTPAQHANVEKILSENHEKLRKLWLHLAPVFHEEVQAVRDKVNAALTPEQQKAFEGIPMNVGRNLAPPREWRRRKGDETNSQPGIADIKPPFKGANTNQPASQP